MIMQRIFVVGIMALLSLMMTVKASDTAGSLYDRFGVYCSLGSGESINRGLSEISKHVLTDMSESAFVLDLGFFWFPSRHWGVNARFDAMGHIGYTQALPVKYFGFDKGYVEASEDNSPSQAYFTISPIYRVAIKRVMLTGEVGLGMMLRNDPDSFEFLCKNEGNNYARRMSYTVHGSDFFAVVPRISAMYFFGDKINLAICASLGCSISMGTMKSKYSVTDAYNGAVIKSSSESIHAPAMFSATIGLVWSFSSWRRSKK